jgi:hypothetical protein
MILILNGRITTRDRMTEVNGATRPDPCNLAREARRVEIGAGNFLFESTVTH